MKSEGQIKQKAKQVIFRHRKEYVRHGLARRPENCAYNEEVHLPVHMSNRATLRVCGYCANGDGRNNVVCDSTMGGDKQAQNCPYFKAERTAKTLKADFNKKLGLSGSDPVEIGYIAKEYPDVAALLWVLGPGKEQNTKEPAPEEEQSNILAFFGDPDDEPEDVPERPLVEDGHES